MYNEKSYKRLLFMIKVKRVFFIVLIALGGSILGGFLSTYLVDILMFSNLSKSHIVIAFALASFILGEIVTTGMERTVHDGYWKMATLRKLTLVSKKLDRLERIEKILSNIDDDEDIIKNDIEENYENNYSIFDEETQKRLRETNRIAENKEFQIKFGASDNYSIFENDSQNQIKEENYSIFDEEMQKPSNPETAPEAYNTNSEEELQIKHDDIEKDPETNSTNIEETKPDEAIAQNEENTENTENTEDTEIIENAENTNTDDHISIDNITTMMENISNEYDSNEETITNITPSKKNKFKYKKTAKHHYKRKNKKKKR